VSNDIDLIKQEIWESLTDKVRRDAFVASHLSDNIGSQIFSLREARGWSQEKLAAETGMAQPRISILEAGCDCSIRTLKRFASVYDVALVVRFVPFSELVDWIAGLSEERLAPVDFANDNLSEEISSKETEALPQIEPSVGIIEPMTTIIPSGLNAQPTIGPVGIGASATPSVIGVTGFGFPLVAGTAMPFEIRPTASGD
jgi:transcriptional regulator with XRE-family HTH domain